MFVNLPTGFGKSLIYQLAPLIVEEMSRLGGKIRSVIILLISPLVSLMKDQVQCTERKGIKASFIGGDKSRQICRPSLKEKCTLFIHLRKLCWEMINGVKCRLARPFTKEM